MAIFGRPNKVIGPAPDLSIEELRRSIAAAQTSAAAISEEYSESPAQGSNLEASGSVQLQAIVDYMTQNGLTNTSQVPDEYKRWMLPRDQRSSIGEVTADFFTNPAVLLPLTMGAGMVAGGGAVGGAAGGAADLGSFNAVGAPVANAGLGSTAGATAAGVQGGFGYTAAQTAAGQAAAEGAGGIDLTQGATGGEAGPGGVGGAGGVPTSSGLGGAGAAAASGTALERLLNGTATDADYISLLGSVGETGLALYGDKAARDQQQAQFDQFWGLGAPLRDAATGYLNDPSSYFQGPVAQENLRSVGQSLSKNLGNPAGSPYAQTIMAQGANRDYFGTIGGLFSAGMGGTGAAANAGQGAINAGQSMYSDLGYGINQITNPRKLSLADIIRSGGNV